MSPAAELLQRYKIVLVSTAPGRCYTTCPKCSAKRSVAHQKQKVLGVTIGSDGKVSWGCNHCGWTGPEKGSGINSKAADGLTTYDYVDCAGKLLFQKVRKPPGSPGDRFFVQRPDGRGGWIKNLKDVPTPRPLYRWPEILAAMKEDREIAIAEGEKDCSVLWRLDIPATCNFDGTSDVIKNPNAKPKWKPEYSEALRGARIIVLNDNDPPGYAHAATICRLSLGVAKRIRRLDLAPHWPEIPKGGDVSDYLAAGHTVAQLEDLIAAAPDYVPAGPGEALITDANKSDDDDVELERLAKLTAVDYERNRAAAAKVLGVRTAMLDKLVAAKRGELGLDADDKQGRAIELPEAEPWPQPVDGTALLGEISSAIARHVVMPPHASDAIALWTVHTHLVDRFLVSPRLALRSVTKQCGKTTSVDILSRIVHRPLPTVNVTAAAIFRIVEAHRPTLLIDEADTFLKDDEGLRGIINSGHRQGGYVLRIEGDNREPRAFSTYTPTAIAAIGSLPGTIMDRSIIVDLVRRKADEKIEPFRLDRTGALDEIARRIARWARDNSEGVTARDPEMPPGLFNRTADNWRPLFQIADQAGGPWPARARAAAMAAAPDVDEVSRIELLLGDIRDIFNEKEVDRIAGAALIEDLCKIMPRPWAEYGKAGKPITPNKLARLLKPLKVAPQLMRTGSDVARGYFRHQFDEAFTRYLACEGVPNRYRVTNVDSMGTSGPSQTVTAEKPVTDGKLQKSNNNGLRNAVTVEKGGGGADAHSGPPSAYRPKVTGASWLEVIGPEPDGTVCVQCRSPAPTVYLIRDPGRGVACQALHEQCSRFFFPKESR
jgi:Protein of unknown function (DUF3631)